MEAARAAIRSSDVEIFALPDFDFGGYKGVIAHSRHHAEHPWRWIIATKPSYDSPTAAEMVLRNLVHEYRQGR